MLSSPWNRSGFRRRPVINPTQGPTHERGLVAVRQAIGDTKRLDSLLVGQQLDGPRPVSAPHAAIEAECVEDAAAATGTRLDWAGEPESSLKRQSGKGFGKVSENLSTRVSVQRPNSAIPRGNTPVHADYSSEAYLFSAGTWAPRILTMLSSAASAFASSGLTGAFLQRGSVLCSAPNMASVIGIGAHPWSCSHTMSNSAFASL